MSCRIYPLVRHRAIVTLRLCILAAAHSGCMTAAAALQPENIGGETIVLTTTDADGESHERVPSPIDYDGRLFVAANHWPRAWYHRALENPDVSVTRNGETPTTAPSLSAKRNASASSTSRGSRWSPTSSPASRRGSSS